MSWQVYGTVMHVNRGNPAGQEVLVDSWPEFKIVLTRPNREVRPLLGPSHLPRFPPLPDAIPAPLPSPA